jgi:hypothetical protein
MNLLDPGCFSQEPSNVSPSLQADYDLTAESNEAKSLVTTERIFAALDLIGRINPSFGETDHIEQVVLEKSSSNVWQVREQAARLYASRISPWDALDVLGRVVDGMSLQKDQNAIHGRLLCVKQILRLLRRSRAEPLSSDLEGAASILKLLITHIMVASTSAVVRTSFLDIMNDAFEMEILSCTSYMMSSAERNIADQKQAPTRLNGPSGLEKTSSEALGFRYVILAAVFCLHLLFRH